jgi:hypothetical protein
MIEQDRIESVIAVVIRHPVWFAMPGGVAVNGRLAIASRIGSSAYA